jgi:hypothetical protein
MSEVIRILLILGIAGAALTMIGAAIAWWRAEDRRLGRLITRVFDGPADAQIIGRGQNAAIAIGDEPPQILVMQEGGAKARLYQLAHLLGAELDVDDVLVSRAFLGEARMPLDHAAANAQTVVLRLLFYDPKHPDFDLVIWSPRRRRSQDQSSDIAIRDGGRWVARIDALLRQHARDEPRSALPPPIRRGPPPPAPLFDDLELEHPDDQTELEQDLFDEPGAQSQRRSDASDPPW